MGDNREAEEKARTLFFHHMRKRVHHNDVIKEAQEARKKDGNMAKADGITLEELDFAIKSDGMEDRQIPANKFQSWGRILSWLGIIPGFQGDLLRDRMPAMERIEAQGERAGFLNKPRESGFNKNSNEDTAWLKGFDSAQATFKKTIEAALEEAAKARPAGKKPTGKRASGGKAAPIEGDTPDDGKAAQAKKETPKPPKPGSKKAQVAGDDGKTNAEREAERQDKPDFVH